MIKQPHESLIVELNLDGMEYALSILSGRSENLKLMDEAISETADDVDKWLMNYYLKLKKLFETKNKKVFTYND